MSPIAVPIFDMMTIFLGFLLINAWTFCLFGWDKIRAESGGWRVAETSLLGLALIGGSVGAFSGRALFRHKTRKQSFSNSLYGIAIFQVAAIVFATIFFW